MLRIISIILLLFAFCACKNSNKHDKPFAMNDKLFIGDWVLDSSSNSNFYFDRLIMLSNGQFYIFSGADGGSLSSKGVRIGKDSISIDSSDNIGIMLIDSNRLKISGGSFNREDFYKRITNGNYRENLKHLIQSDSLRKKVIGWWKLINPKTPIHLINYSERVHKFTLNIRDDGSAIFYRENKLDSSVFYNYRIHPTSIDFIRGCVVGSNSKIAVDNKGRLNLVLDKINPDTLLLERLTEHKIT